MGETGLDVMGIGVEMVEAPAEVHTGVIDGLEKKTDREIILELVALVAAQEATIAELKRRVHDDAALPTEGDAEVAGLAQADKAGEEADKAGEEERDNSAATPID